MTPRAGTVQTAFLLLLVLCAACAAPEPSEPSGSRAASPEAAGAFLLGCIGIDQPECQSVSQKVAGRLPAERGLPFSIVIELYDCADSAPCPPSLAARQGRATAEYVGGAEPIVFELAGPPETPAIHEARFMWSGLIAPSSARVPGPGPFPYEVGHCGLTWQVDFDGSFWLLVGQIQPGAFALINGESGTIRLLDANHAVYTSPTGFTAQLVRFPGPKHIWLCD